ncbi:DUF1127 domain-containing protein [Rhodophyticola sp. CCM32]|uniref:DUF1127 domain-containing protein n=1 Tax=Rhodophyticola sp. CCM32 TaxID=2916397 RepID=UPI00107F089C|nr:DUF1127 domain-containing protein [Rhodophyticola sp. CCM32]QBX99770.1 DUF1127 domain-containing protein [Rhodophyticola sp. CCM32]
MAANTTNIKHPGTIVDLLTKPFVAFGNFMVNIMENNSRYREVEFLQALSDEDLAKRGLKRDDIVRHVFGHLFV